MVKIKVNVKTKNDSIPSDTTKRKMPVITNPKIRRTPRRDDTNVGDIRVKVKFQKPKSIQAIFRKKEYSLCRSTRRK